MRRKVKEIWDWMWSPPRTWSLLRTIVELSVGGLSALVLAWFLWGLPIKDTGARATMSLATVGGLSGLVALIVAYRKQVSNERKQVMDERKQGEIERNEVDGKLTDAVRLLGEERPSTRIAGVYALMNVGDLHPDRRQQIIDILCGYLRTKRDHNGENDGPTESTIITALRSKLKADSWTKNQGIRIDLCGATIGERFDFSGVRLHDFVCYDTTFDGFAAFNNVTFENDASFENATFNGITTFDDAAFNGFAAFNDAAFNNTVSFDDAAFNGFTLFDEVVFNDDAAFNNTAFNNTVSFDDKNVVEKISKNATFNQLISFKSIRRKNDAKGDK